MYGSIEDPITRKALLGLVVVGEGDGDWGGEGWTTIRAVASDIVLGIRRKPPEAEEVEEEDDEDEAEEGVGEGVRSQLSVE